MRKSLTVNHILKIVIIQRMRIDPATIIPIKCQLKLPIHKFQRMPIHARFQIPVETQASSCRIILGLQSEFPIFNSYRSAAVMKPEGRTGESADDFQMPTPTVFKVFLSAKRRLVCRFGADGETAFRAVMQLLVFQNARKVFRILYLANTSGKRWRFCWERLGLFWEHIIIRHCK